MTSAAMAAAPVAPVTISADKVLAAALWDANGDGGIDRAVLVATDDDPVLHVFLTQPGDRAGVASLHLVAPHLARAGTMSGQLPTLTATPQGSLQVASENASIGRDRWARTLTLAYRDGQLVVAGFTSNTYDTLDPDAAHSCDLNLLTGKGSADGKPISVPPAAIAAAAWTDASAPQACPR